MQIPNVIYYLDVVVEHLFYQMVQHLHHIGEVNFENLFVDGTKIEANANRYTFVWKKVVNKNEAKMFIKFQSCIDKINLDYMTSFTVTKETLLDDLKIVLTYLEERRKQEQIEFVYGIGIFQDRNDTTTLIPFLNEMESHLKTRYQNIIADSGYESEENYLYLEEKEQTYYIKPQTYEKWKNKSFKNDISKREKYALQCGDR